MSAAAALRSVTQGTAEYEALLARRASSEHRAAFDHARVLLDHLVTRAARNVVAVRPQRRARIVREERPQEFISIVRTEWIVGRTHRVTH